MLYRAAYYKLTGVSEVELTAFIIISETSTISSRVLCAASQKTVIFILGVVRTRHLTYCNCFTRRTISAHVVFQPIPTWPSWRSEGHILLETTP
jgi:hypothetical protein